MLQSLSIKNFALIDHLQVDFSDGLSTITGETGAGKSILLGGLALVLGKRAELSSLKDKEKKCIVEAEFNIKNYNLKSFFQNNDIDYEALTIIRREILPSGKSRAFINDTPINLTVLNELSAQLIDVHSQHQTLQLANTNFQFQLIDALAGNKKYLDSYQRGLKIYKTLQREFNEIQKSQNEAKKQYDYHLFLFQELEKADFQENEQKELEQKLDQLNNAEQITQSLLESVAIIQAEENGILDAMDLLKSNLSKITSFSKEFKSLYSRINSVKIEMDDISNELESESEKVVSNPFEIEKYNDRLQLLYDLYKKHSVEDIVSLNKVFQELDLKVQEVDDASKNTKHKRETILKVENQLNKLADNIHKNRIKAIPGFVQKLERTLANLEMPSVKFQINLNLKTEFLNNGKDTLDFLISTNKGGNFTTIKKGPSGGEMSRIILAVKSIFSKYKKLPTIIFDEIDTGVSGEVSNKIANVMLKMSENMQVISITHLPQIAAKGKQHYKVFKKENNQHIETNIKQLSQDERLNEIAEMLGGKEISNSALAHAKQLLKK
ncbi:MAG: DNA repair protein RecN [Flavobacteriaceae bacterium]